MRRADEIRLRHMLDAAREAVAFARDRTRGELAVDRQLILAVVKDLEILGEAASRVSESNRVELPNVPWTKIVAMRNRLGSPV